MESAFNTLRNAETDYKKNQVADPVLAEEMAYAEKDAHKKKFGIIDPSDEQLEKGQKAMFERGIEALAAEAEKIVPSMKILERQKREKDFDGELISFEYDGHVYKFDHFISFQKEDDMAPDYFQLVSVDDSVEFTDDEEKLIIQKFETALRMKLDEMVK